MSRKPSRLGSVAKLTPTTARQMAFRVLDEHSRTQDLVSELIDRVADHAAASEPPLLTELVNGIVRRRATLNAIIKSHITRRRDQVEDALWALLQLGTYQLVFLSSVPPHAAIHETVELTKWLKKPRWSGFLNGVLRSIQRTLTNDFCNEPQPKGVPISDARFRILSADVFPNPSGEFADYFSTAFSFPKWMAKRWSDRFEQEEMLRIGFYFNRTPTTYLRVNQLKTIRTELMRELEAKGVDVRDGNRDESIRVQSAASLFGLPEFKQGHFTVQDESAMSAAKLLNPLPGQTVLDLCAAPGTKTTHLAELMNNQGHILAADVNSDRLRRVDENCARLGINIVETCLIDRNSTNIPQGPFDTILVDAPCSNTGVLSRRPEVRWRLKSKDIKELAEIQSRLVATAIDRLKPGGRIVYSTCSIEPEECQDVVNKLIAQNPRAKIVAEQSHNPGDHADGGYQVLLRVV